MLQSDAVRCSVLRLLQCVAVCVVLQCVAVNVLKVCRAGVAVIVRHVECVGRLERTFWFVRCSVLQSAAVCCSACCSVL